MGPEPIPTVHPCSQSGRMLFFHLHEPSHEGNARSIHNNFITFSSFFRFFSFCFSLFFLTFPCFQFFPSLSSPLLPTLLHLSPSPSLPLRFSPAPAPLLFPLLTPPSFQVFPPSPLVIFNVFFTSPPLFLVRFSAFCFFHSLFSEFFHRVEFGHFCPSSPRL